MQPQVSEGDNLLQLDFSVSEGDNLLQLDFSGKNGDISCHTNSFSEALWQLGDSFY